MAVKKSTKKKKKARVQTAAAPPDIRAPLAPTPAHLTATVAAIRTAVTGLTPPPEPNTGELIDVMLHITFAEGIPCGVGQECVRRIREEFVDLNEFRLTEGFEVERLLGDLGIPELFDRSVRARESIAEVYNDQNAISLEFLREASVTDRNLFFQRMPVLKPAVQHFLLAVLSFEEVLFSDRSTLRVQQRLGFDPKDKGVDEFFAAVRELVLPFGHLPCAVGPAAADGRPVLEPPLSAASLCVRLAPAGKGK